MVSTGTPSPAAAASNIDINGGADLVGKASKRTWPRAPSPGSAPQARPRRRWRPSRSRAVADASAHRLRGAVDQARVQELHRLPTLDRGGKPARLLAESLKDPLQAGVDGPVGVLDLPSIAKAVSTSSRATTTSLVAVRNRREAGAARRVCQQSSAARQARRVVTTWFQRSNEMARIIARPRQGSGTWSQVTGRRTPPAGCPREDRKLRGRCDAASRALIEVTAVNSRPSPFKSTHCAPLATSRRRTTVLTNRRSLLDHRHSRRRGGPTPRHEPLGGLSSGPARRAHRVAERQLRATHGNGRARDPEDSGGARRHKPVISADDGAHGSRPGAPAAAGRIVEGGAPRRRSSRWWSKH